MALSKSQIDKLGERLRKGRPLADADLRLLDEFRHSFRESFDHVVEALGRAMSLEPLSLEPVSRPAKFTDSIIQKLQRESIRLSQIQDIAGCRVLVENRLHQDTIASAVQELFDRVDLVDRRAHPTHGYRAVHLVVHTAGRPVEIQLRTDLQHLWAQLSEKLSDRLGPSVKYGGGDAETRRELWESSESIARIEELEHRLMLRYSSLTGLRQDRLEEADSAAVTDVLGVAFMVNDLAAMIHRRKRDESNDLIDWIVSLDEGHEDGVSD